MQEYNNKSCNGLVISPLSKALFIKESLSGLGILFGAGLACSEFLINPSKLLFLDIAEPISNPNLAEAAVIKVVPPTKAARCKGGRWPEAFIAAAAALPAAAPAPTLGIIFSIAILDTFPTF